MGFLMVFNVFSTAFVFSMVFDVFQVAYNHTGSFQGKFNHATVSSTFL